MFVDGRTTINNDFQALSNEILLEVYNLLKSIYKVIYEGRV